MTENYKDEFTFVNLEENSNALTKIPVGCMVARLFKGVVYKTDEPTMFMNIVFAQKDIREYIQQLGLYLYINAVENFAYLRSMTDEEYELAYPNSKYKPATIMQKRKLSFDVSFLMVYLRKRLIEHDITDGSINRLIIDSQEIYADLASFYNCDSTNSTFIKKIDAAIKKTLQLGFLKSVNKDAKGEQFEVKKILISLLPATAITEMNDLIEQYKEKALKSLNETE